MKGAAEQVLASCKYYLNENGEKLLITDEIKLNLLQVISSFAKQALRTICFAYKDLTPNEGGANHSDSTGCGVLRNVEKSDFTVLSIFGISDIIRPEVSGAVAVC